MNNADHDRQIAGGWLFDELLPAMRRYAFVVAFLVTAGFAVATVYVLKTTVYSAGTSIAILRASTSSVEAISSRFGGGGSAGFRLGREDPVIEKLLTFLAAREYYEELATKVATSQDFRAINRSLRLTVSPRLQQVMEYVGLVQAARLDAPMSEGELAEALLGVVAFSRSSNGNLQVSTTLRDKHIAVLLANMAGEHAVTHVIKKELEEFDQASAYVTERLASASTEVKRLNGLLEELTVDAGGDKPQGPGATPGRLFELQRELDFATMRKEQNDIILKVLRSDRKALLDRTVKQPLPAATVYQREAGRLEVQSEALKYRRDGLVLQGRSVTSPEVTAIDQEILGIAAKLRDAKDLVASTPIDDVISIPLIDAHIERIITENIGFTAHIRAAQAAIKRTVDAESRRPNNHQRHVELTRQVTVQYELMTELYRSSLQFDFQRISAQNKVRLVGKAHIGSAYRKPRLTTTIGFGGIVGMTLGALVAIFLDRRRPTVNSRFDLGAFGVPVISSIPAVRQSRARILNWLNRSRQAENVAAHFFASNVVSFKFLRTRVFGALNNQARDKCHIVSVQSASPSEGKTFLASNLAAAAAHIGKRTLLLDCDMVGSRLAASLGFGGAGMTELLHGDTKFADVVHRGVRSNLDIVFAGRKTPDSTELLGSDAFRALIESVRNDYDLIVIDTAPILILPDALLLADVADAVLFSVHRRRTRLSSVAEALNSLSSRRSDGIYFVLNFSDQVQLTGAYRYAIAPTKPATKPPPSPTGERDAS